MELEQLLLALLADLGQEDVAAVAVALLGGERVRRDPVAALVLPAAEAAGHRHDVGVAELLQRLGRERRAGAARAVDDDGASWSGILFSTWLSRWPRGMNTEPGIMPCSNSSSSRTSRKVASPSRGSASAGGISRISDFVCFSSSRKLAITTPPDGPGRACSWKCYRGGRIFPTVRPGRPGRGARRRAGPARRRRRAGRTVSPRR